MCDSDSGSGRVSAKIIRLDDFRTTSAPEAECDIATAIDVAIRDLREILQYWGTDAARVRAQECERMLSRVFRHGVNLPPAS
jgi:hypothetical protein